MIACDVPYFMTSGAIPFEERVVTLIGFIESHKTKLDCIKIMAEEWPVPWYPLMDSAVKKCLEMNVNGDPYCRNLQKTIELMRIQVPFRCLLVKYRLIASRLTVAFNVKVSYILHESYLAHLNRSISKKVRVFRFQHTIKRILKSKKEHCYEDCLELIKHTGKCDENGVKYIKFWYELSETTMSLEEDVLAENIETDLARRFLDRILHQFNVVRYLIVFTERIYA